ncbi:hypothetical protein GN958_ATG09304 [Phytophthora infestans]|uniref:Uncharacterized protein n=1 Tax=Phytophthora infestans TaxID=4787 RepID=A0A8S9ULE0_PHYIN|nr:hypothetical protein GN958_ATG09304 [Phytophthora infestans]
MEAARLMEAREAGNSITDGYTKSEDIFDDVDEVQLTEVASDKTPPPSFFKTENILDEACEASSRTSEPASEGSTRRVDITNVPNQRTRPPKE